MAATTALREALNEGISSGSLVDTKIILYSHRDSSGRVCRPKALYANSCVLKTVPYFNDLLFGDFAESRQKELKESIDADESTNDYGYSSDSDLEDSEDEKTFSPKPTANSTVKLLELFESEMFIYESHEERIDKGKLVKIPDMAFVTFQAFLMYLYTGAIEFAPFGSEQNRRSRSSEISNPSEDKVPRPSPKSIYRLADKYDIPALKALALEWIRSGLTKCDIVEESFSRFAYQYDEIRSLYVQQLAHTLVEDPWIATSTGIATKIESFVGGDLEHAAETVNALWKTLYNDEDIKAPSKTSSPVVQAKNPTHWNSVKIALINSIRTGVFFDKKYWARHSHAGLKPVYLSSTIMDDKAPLELNDLIKYLIGQSTPVLYPEVETNGGNGREGDLLEADEGASVVAEGSEEQVRAVLIAGSFSAWKTLFFYRCTDEILFAPLESQGVVHLKCIHETTVAATPAPCSLKSAYLLANLLEIRPLRNALESKMPTGKSMGEVRNWVNATQQKIMEMKSEKIIPSLKDPRMISLMSQKIGRISDRSSSDFFGVLKFGLKKVVENKKRSRGLLLRCFWYRCPGRTVGLILYSSDGSKVCCPYCNNGYCLGRAE